MDAFLVDIAGKSLRHNPTPRYGETVELHLRNYNSNIRVLPVSVCLCVLVCVFGATTQIGLKPPCFGGFYTTHN
jgi:hypothetical protein